MAESSFRVEQRTPPDKLMEVIRTFIDRTDNQELKEILRKLYGELKLKHELSRSANPPE